MGVTQQSLDDFASKGSSDERDCPHCGDSFPKTRWPQHVGMCEDRHGETEQYGGRDFAEVVGVSEK